MLPFEPHGWVRLRSPHALIDQKEGFALPFVDHPMAMAHLGEESSNQPVDAEALFETLEHWNTELERLAITFPELSPRLGMARFPDR